MSKSSHFRHHLRFERLERRYPMDATGVVVTLDDIFPEEIDPSTTGWHGAVSPADVNQDGVVSPLDAHVVLNDLSENGSRAVGNAELESSIDVNGDGSVTPADVLIVINGISSSRSISELAGCAHQATGQNAGLPGALMTTDTGLGASMGISFDDILRSYPDDRTRIAESNDDVLDVTISTASDRCSTNGDPPVLSIQVHEVLRGPRMTDSRQAIWSPLPHDIDYSGGDSSQRLKEWRSMPLAAPAPGTRMIVLGRLVGGEYRLLQHVQIRSSDTNLRLAREAIEWGEQLRHETREYWDTFPENVNYSNEELLEIGRPVTEETRLEVRQPVLVRDAWFAGVGRSRVIDLLQDGRVKVRPYQYNSRWDRIVARDTLLLYATELQPYEEQMTAW